MYGRFLRKSYEIVSFLLIQPLYTMYISLFAGVVSVMKTFQDKLTVLRSLEGTCYSLCVYLLRCERDAAEAAKRALVALFEDQQFWTSDSNDRLHRMRRTAVRECMQHTHTKGEYAHAKS